MLSHTFHMRSSSTNTTTTLALLPSHNHFLSPLPNNVSSLFSIPRRNPASNLRLRRHGVKAVLATQKSTSVKAVVTVLQTVGGALTHLGLDRGIDDIADLLGRTLQLHLVSAELDAIFHALAPNKMSRGLLKRFDLRPRAIRTPIKSRDELSWESFESIEWDQYLGVVRNLKRIQVEWQRLKKAGGLWRSAAVCDKIREILPDFMEKIAFKLCVEQSDYEVGVGEVVCIDRFLRYLMAWWDEQVFGKNLHDETDDETEADAESIGSRIDSGMAVKKAKIEDEAGPSGTVDDPIDLD